MSAHVYYTKWACLGIRKRTPTKPGSSLDRASMLLLVPNWLSSRISKWEGTAGRLNCNQIFTCSNRSRCPSRDQSRRPQASLGCDKWLSLPSLLQHKKKALWTLLKDRNFLNCYKCLLLMKCLWPQNTHTHTQKSEKLVELRIFVQTASILKRRPTWPFTITGLCDILSLNVPTQHHAEQIWCIVSLHSPHAGI